MNKVRKEGHHLLNYIVWLADGNGGGDGEVVQKGIFVDFQRCKTKLAGSNVVEVAPTLYILQGYVWWSPDG